MPFILDSWLSAPIYGPNAPPRRRVTAEDYGLLVQGETIWIDGGPITIDDGPFEIALDSTSQTIG